MILKKCEYCKNPVPPAGQCNKCGFLDGLKHRPKDAEFVAARAVNAKAKYKQFQNIDMLLLES